MKKLLFLFGCLLCLVIAGCSNQSNGKQNDGKEEASNETVTYESETGPVEIPAEPQRIVALSNGPNVFALDGNLVGVDEWTKASPLFEEDMADIEIVSENDPEGILALEPDLIIAGSHMENLDELEKIAPTVIYTWGKLDYLEQQIEIGKLLNKQEEAQEWVDDFTKRAKAVGDKIKEKHGEDVSVSVFETDSKNFAVFGDNWARGTEILYQTMELEMPEKVQEDVLADGYYNLSQETLPEYAGDFIVLSSMGGENEFTKSETWQSIPAVENNQVIEIDTQEASYSDPATLEYLLDIFEEGFLQ
ncbi:iron-hydroxamate ABC transporter substrate-binding protein [Oceanobacillus jeddahense]|uniref:Iron-hydroxamate ABC transporter substrate-binding protein n=1 Tax=Oceanobacillus jeddahense TaxID=1462527 RepID=A0ABY5JVV8_9BACI|nr:iron-hydroxamate ABC transporter substrate-binding protein [Oceanobacillus jeddahense]UUI04513.1 iron-hydroxamate ABC transporter substrate-binding protein [Oceanobacillus jeddahense]